MSRTGWKQVERDFAAAIGAKRCWANSGEREDTDSPLFAAQVKNPKAMSLAEITRLVEEMTVRGIDSGKLPVVGVKLSARRPTPLLAVVPVEVLKMLVIRAELEPVVKAFAALELRDLPGMRERVAAYVRKSKKRVRR